MARATSDDVVLAVVVCVAADTCEALVVADLVVVASVKVWRSPAEAVTMPNRSLTTLFTGSRGSRRSLEYRGLAWDKGRSKRSSSRRISAAPGPRDVVKGIYEMLPRRLEWGQNHNNTDFNAT